MAGRGLSDGAVTAGRRHDEFSEGMTMIIPIDETDLDAAHPTELDWNLDVGRIGEQRRPRRKTSTAEITQDILIPEGEFDQYRHDEPFDILGAAPDDFADGDAADKPRGDLADRPAFRKNPASAPTRSRGKHRISAPPAALRGGRAALVAMAAGAAVAAAMTQADSTDDPAPATSPVPAAAVGDAAAVPAQTGPGVAMSAPDQDMSMYSDQLAVGKQLAADEAARVAAASRPMFATPIDFSNSSCAFTSLFATRWGSFHGGIDLACPLGTPIHAVTDGVVKEAGPASGYGHWVQIQADDGTVTMYGHMASSGVLVQKGQHVTAGQVIALVGNEGFSTGPHLHFEVWKNGATKIDPAPWLAAHGVRLPSYGG